MSKPIITHFRKYISIDETEVNEILNFFNTVTVSKKSNLLSLDMVCRNHYFVESGCLRLFYIDPKGAEQTVQFALENWWITDYDAYAKQKRSSFMIQAVEETTVQELSFTNQELLLERFPKFERYFRLIYERAYAASQFRTRYLYDFSKEAFYNHFNTNFPEFARRVPQQFLASYLNMTPEYLSEIKAKRRS
ncbi:Crp/Fnr family transcriptional regulator [Sphingobacterium psychroaquaticum]|uniref:cAMP-binding domain of CRP or a regulatory subunit of cAMP-dependent protein kinases n=1 Tax=Sphingobacterium psychroaquaticum TaxID=561061 RepID=A0A1X7JNJ2_9SPHI|nr:Crp/Fnr family transcriptional regulator [Sphingobacterium psychroaquaticum]QBQ40913.1 Crp/Fnr family transcriptional regulator [Sphingobacterium psychroaquaticum]SMG29768.1 cAMP-binding domain of CRP or a regulatory subunit of cAMP-dependent protein kinases [Sphingobacterium psychroaquaticum]